MLINMKVGERGHVNIPRHIREKFGIDANTRVEFEVVDGSIILRKAPAKLGIRNWRGKASAAFRSWDINPSTNLWTIFATSSDQRARHQRFARHPDSERVIRRLRGDCN